MYKKAGIIVGVTLFLVAILIYWIATGGKDKEETPPVVVEPPTSEVTPNVEIPAVETPPVETPVVVEPVVETPPVTVQPSTETTRITEMSMAALGEPNDQFEEIMLIVKKKVVLLDQDTNGPQAKQLVHAVELQGTKEIVTLYLTGEAYDSVEVGEKVKVIYDVYVNDIGVRFPILRYVEPLG